MFYPVINIYYCSFLLILLLIILPGTSAAKATTTAAASRRAVVASPPVPTSVCASKAAAATGVFYAYLIFYFLPNFVYSFSSSSFAPPRALDLIPAFLFIIITLMLIPHQNAH